jgi:hypothetical protein
VNWDFIVLFGTMMFWALLHLWSPDGRQWRHDIAEPEQPAGDHAAPDPLNGDVAAAPPSRRS